MATQTENLERVRQRIVEAVIVFARSYRPGQTFRLEELRYYVETKVGPTAPDSAGRILRDLRRRGCLNYRVVSRSQSLYEVIERSLFP